MTAYNPAEVERLIAEAREDDARMTPAPWAWDNSSHRLEGPYDEQPDAEIGDPGIRHCIIETDGGHYPPGAVVGSAIARTRNNLATPADQLEAARLEIAARQTALAELTAALDAMPLGGLRGAAPWVVQLVKAALKMCPTVDPSKETP